MDADGEWSRTRTPSTSTYSNKRMMRDVRHSFPPSPAFSPSIPPPPSPRPLSCMLCSLARKNIHSAAPLTLPSARGRVNQPHRMETMHHQKVFWFWRAAALAVGGVIIRIIDIVGGGLSAKCLNGEKCVFLRFVPPESSIPLTDIHGGF